MEVTHHRLIFRRPSGTSRGVLKTKDSWIIKDANGIGEVSIIEGLSRNSYQDYQQLFAQKYFPPQDTGQWPALDFGLEMVAHGQKSNDPFLLFDTPFYHGQQSLAINGLIWMGTRGFMFDQIRTKLSEGYRCLKLKIGAIDFEEELSLLRYVRSQFSADDVELRVDANGAFCPSDALSKLERLSDFDLHSIEQPINPNQEQEMALLCANSPLPIALDEELITPQLTPQSKRELLQIINPQYIILKPSLIGGLKQADQWISEATSLNIGWWATSALESNIGLNAICQWVSQYPLELPQGLGTGQLYTNNVDSPLTLKGGYISYNPDLGWDLSLIEDQ